MKTKAIKNSLIREYPNLFPAPDGRRPAAGMSHVYKEENFYILFKGDLNMEHDKTSCVVHDALGAIAIMSLQIILSYPDPVSRVQYEKQILKMIAQSPDTQAYTLRQLADKLHNSIDWIEWALNLRIEFEGKTTVANAYALSKLRCDWDAIPKELVDTIHHHPCVFVPRVVAYHKELKSKKPRKGW